MAALANLSFEDAGGDAGDADQWTVTIVATGGQVGTFDGGAGAPRGIESYELGWLADEPFVATFTGGSSASFDGAWISPPVFRETYARWYAAGYLSAISGGTAGQFFGSATIEQYEGGWVTSYATVIAAAPIVSDNYETGWLIDAPYDTAFTGGTVGTFRTPSGTATRESYEHIFADVPFTTDLANNKFVTATPHDLTNNQKGSCVTTGKIPGGTPAGTNLFVIVLTSTTFQLSVTPGPGSPITLTDVGFGEHAFRSDPAKYWTNVL